MSRREKKTHYETDPQRTIEFFKLPDGSGNDADRPDGEVFVYNSTLLSNVKFILDDPMIAPQLVSYVETDVKKILAGGPKAANPKAIVIAEYIHGEWYITKEIVIPDEEE